MDSFKRVKVEFAIREIPNVGSRSFIDTLHFQPSHDVIFLQDAVRNKLQVVGCEGCDFEILMGEYYVDNSYFDELIEELFAPPARKQPSVSTSTNNGGGGGSILLGIGGKSQQQQQQQDDSIDNSASSPLRWKFDVTVKAKRLTKDVLQRMMQQGGGMVDGGINSSPTTMMTSYPTHPPPPIQVEAVPIGSLSYTLTRGKYRVEGRVRSVRKKTANISEVELVDLHLQHNVITVITFSQICADRLAALKPNTCYEFKNIQCSQKNARDLQYSSNGHTMKIIVDDSSEVRPIPDPVTNYASSDQITTIIGGKTSRDVGGVNGYVPGAMATPFPTMTLLNRNNNSGDMLDTSSSSAAYTTTSDRGPLTSTTSSSSLGGRGFLGSSQNGGVMGRPPQPRTTLLQRPPSSITTGSTATSGMRSAGTTTTLLRPPSIATYASPSSPTTAHHHQVEESSPITSRDTQLLLEIAAEEAEAEELKRRRTEASPQCILCGHNLACETDRKDIQRRKDVWSKSATPSEPLIYEDLRAEMRDKRSQIPGYRSEQYRMYCRAQFRHPLTKELHKVHCRCAHLAYDYQSGSDMATTVLNASMAECNLCGEMGATVACLHPDCKKRYHTLCAILSNGHVDFDQRDPYLPKPACPTHTNPGVKRRRPVLLKWDGDAMDTSAGTAAFDSAIVNRYDLRDPDDDSRA